MGSRYPILESARLLFRRLTMNDLDSLTELYPDPEVMRYVGEGRPRSREDTREKLRVLIDAEAHQGFGVWATVERSTGRFIGRCGLAVWIVEGHREVEVLYLLGRVHWGKGLGTEAATVIRDYALHTLGHPRLISLIHPANTASQGVAQKAGFCYERDVSFMGQCMRMFSIQKWKKANRM